MSGLGACAEPAAPTTAGAGTPSSRASPSVVEAVRTATTRAAGKTEHVAAPGGGQLDHVVLGEGYRHVAIGRLEPDGTVTTACVDNASQAETFLTGGAGNTR
jgi:hypothetical protein